VTDDELIAWSEAFASAHGYAPWEDPDLARKGLSGEDMIAEHLAAKEFSDEFANAFGYAPSRHQMRHEQPRRYVNGQLVSGFGGYPPERIAQLREQYTSAGRGPRAYRPRFSTSAYSQSRRRVPSPY
jgi:hypothetical protein